MAGVAMKLEGGLWATAAMLGIAATVGVSTRTQPETEGARPHASVELSAAAKTPAIPSIENGPCADIEKRLQAFFLVGKDEIGSPESCFPDGLHPAKAGKAPDRIKHLRFVIATLPDPLHTHFPLIFDRAAEAIQQAAQDDHYVYDSSWLPWETDRLSYVRLDDQDKTDNRREREEDQPGILLFRKAVDPASPMENTFEKGLAVLIVGEEPTGGIHRRQFENAVQWVAALQPANNPVETFPLQILGPSFSGSLPSLVALLHNSAGILAANTPVNLRVFSGTVNSDAGVDWFKGAINDTVLAPLKIQFLSFQNSGNVDLDRYCRYIVASGTELARLAIVSEDETAFGGEYAAGKADSSPCRPLPAKGGGTTPGPVYLYYPRDISTLRAAYQSQSIFSRTKIQPNPEATRRTLQDNLADPEGKDHDTIRGYSGSQTALSQESELQQIVSLMRSHKTEYIVLRSSNPLDQLFLSQFFRMTYPEGRIVIVGADLLLRRETGAGGLNGVMTLSTYPLFTWEQDWTKRPPVPGGNPRFHEHRVYSHDGAEGTYMAARFMLYRPATVTTGQEITSTRAASATALTDGERANSGFVPSNCLQDLDLPDYGPPFWMNNPSGEPCRHPPTWLSVLANNGFWPVAVMDYQTQIGKVKQFPIRELGEDRTLAGRMGDSIISIYSSVAFFLGGDVRRHPPRILLEMPLSMKLLMLGGLVWATFHALCCCRGSITVKPAHRAHFVRPGCSTQRKTDEAYLLQLQQSHRALVLFGSILVAMFPIALAWGYGEMWKDGEPVTNPWVYRAFLPLIWFITCLGVCTNTWVEEFLAQRGDIDPIGPPDPKASNAGKLLVQGFVSAARKSKIPAVVWRSFLNFTLLSLLAYWCLDFSLDGALNTTNRFPTYWRAINLTTGVSPLVPLAALIAGLYGWFWFALQGLALFGDDRPQLPDIKNLKIVPFRHPGDGSQPIGDLLRMLSSEWAGNPLEQLSSPLSVPAWKVTGLCFVVTFAAAWFLFGHPPIRNLGSTDYSVFFCLWLILCVSMLLASTWQLAQVWLRLRSMLQFLDRLPLRRTLAAFKGFSWSSAWKMSGNVLDMRYKLIFRQLESMTHLRASLLEWEKHRPPVKGSFTVCEESDFPDLPKACAWIKKIDATTAQRLEFAQWHSLHWDDWEARSMTGIRLLQESLAETAGMILTELLIPTWRSEERSLILDLKQESAEDGKDKGEPCSDSVHHLAAHIRNGEELVCMVYMGFIQNILGRMRSLVMGMICVFVSITVSVSSYPFDPHPVLSGLVVVLFLLVGTTIVSVYSQMHRDSTLSNLTDTKPGELGSDFWIKLIGFGAGPALGVIASVFPEFTQFLFSWVQPGAASIQ